MAKTLKTKGPSKAELEAEIVVEAIEIVAVNEASAIQKFVPFDQQLKSLIEEVETMPKITDKVSLQYAEALSKKLRKFEIAVDKTRLVSTKPVRDMLDSLKAHCDGMIKTSEDKRAFVDDQINAEAIRLQKEAEAEHIRRVGMLTEAGWTLVGQFYHCGPHSIMSDQIDICTEEQLNSWVAQGSAWVESERQRIAAEAQRRSELERKENELAERQAAMDAELEEFRRWKASQGAPAPEAPAADVPVFGAQAAPENIGGAQADPNPVGGAQVAPEPVIKSLFDNPQESVSVPESSMPKSFPNAVPAAPTQAGQVVEHPVGTIEQLASLRRSSVEFLTKTPEYRVFYNSAINDVLSRFSTETKTWEQWMETFKGMLK